MSFAQKNVTLDKVTTRLDLAGISTLAPILSGLHASVTLTLHSGETLKQLKIYNDSFENVLSPTVSGTTATVSNIVFGTDTDTGRNYIQWRTSNGTAEQQFYVAAAPTSQGIYINNQEAQSGTAYVYREVDSTNERNKDVSLAFNILPYWADEFFKQQWYTSNAYANTLRHWGGAKTAQVLIDGSTVISESNINTVHSYYWNEPSFGYHSVEVRLRALSGSSYYVSLNGNIRVRQIACGT